MIQAIFFDVDGTLVSHNQNAVPQSARRALQLLQEAGIRRVLATGRHMLELQNLPVKDIPFDGYITLNGQLCLDDRGQVFSGNPITGKDKEEILRIFQEKELPMVLVEKDAMYLNYVNRQVEIAQKAVSSPIPPLGEYTGNDFYLAVGFLDKAAEPSLSQQLPGCTITRWNEFAVDIISNEGGKTVGIQRYLEQNHIPLENTMAFGDGENDAGMLCLVGTGIAMGNGDPCTKEAADYITTSVDEDGIEKALQHYHLI